MNTTEKLLTVIVPSYNMEAYLAKCLGSLLVPDEDMLRRLDVIVVNDGSTDRTSEIAHDFERRHPGVFHVIDKENGNYGSCVNAALPKAVGFYVRLLDADDSVDTVEFERLLALLADQTRKSAQPADLVLTDMVFVDPDGNVFDRFCHAWLPPGVPRTLQDVPETLTRFWVHTVVYRTGIFGEIEYRQTENSSYTDLEWTIEPMTRVRRVVRAPFPVSRYLVGRAGQTMEPQTYAHRYGNFVQIACGLASRFQNRLARCVPESRAYYERTVLSFLSEIFSTVLYGYKGFRVSADLKPLDEAIRKDADLFEKTENVRVGSRKFPVRIIHAWRQHPGSGTPILVAYGWFRKAKAAKRRLLDTIRPNARQRTGAN